MTVFLIMQIAAGLIINPKIHFLNEFYKLLFDKGIYGRQDKKKGRT